MPQSLHLTANGYLVPAGGYPLALSAVAVDSAEGVVPPGATSVSVDCQVVAGVTPDGQGAAPASNGTLGTASVYLALFAAPTSVGAADGAPTSTPVATVVGGASTTLTASVPSSSTTPPAAYVVKLWVTGLTGTNYLSVTSAKVV